MTVSVSAFAGRSQQRSWLLRHPRRARRLDQSRESGSHVLDLDTITPDRELVLDACVVLEDLGRRFHERGSDLCGDEPAEQREKRDGLLAGRPGQVLDASRFLERLPDHLADLGVELVHRSGRSAGWVPARPRDRSTGVTPG